jgi:hypothetical protein
VDFSCSQEILKMEIEDKMGKLMDQKMERLQNSMETIFLWGFRKRDIVIQENHEKKENNSVEPQSHMGNISKHLESTNIESHNHDHSSI